MFNLDVVNDVTQEKIDSALSEQLDEIIDRFIRGISKGTILVDGISMDYVIEINDDNEADITIFDC
jgi:hypothetical protein